MVSAKLLLVFLKTGSAFLKHLLDTIRRLFMSGRYSKALLTWVRTRIGSNPRVLNQWKKRAHCIRLCMVWKEWREGFSFTNTVVEMGHSMKMTAGKFRTNKWMYF